MSAEVTPTGCAGACNGSINLLTAGGTGAHTIVWDPVPPNGQGVESAQFLCPGVWTATVHDANGCAITQSWTVIGSEGPDLVVGSTPAHCTTCDGTATVEVTGGVPPFTLAWSLAGTPMGTTPTITDLCAGLYQVMVTDSAGCTSIASVPVTDEGGEDLATTDGSVDCTGDCDGAVSVQFDCTSPACTVTWLDGSGFPIATGTDSLTGLCAGLYFVSVVNGDQCTAIAPAVVDAASAITSDLTVTPVSCPDACDGTASAVPTGGAPPYTFFWEPGPIDGQGTDQVTGLCAGAYKVTITDSTGCAVVDSLIVPGPAPIAIAGIVQGPGCSGACDGAITAIATGGNGGFTYTWAPEPAEGQGTPAASGFCAGTVTLIVSDANGCTGTASWTLDTPDPIAISFSATPSTCGECTGTASATATGGTPDHTWYWLEGNEVMGTGSTISGLCAGLYTVVATDANGCQAEQLVPVEDADGEATGTTDGAVTCPDDCDGAVSVATPCLDGPCTIVWHDAQGAPIGQSGTDAVDLCPGLYLALVTNAAGCLSIDTALVLAPDPVLANLTTTPVTCFGDCDGTATVAPSGGTGGHTIEWTPPPGNGQGGTEALGLCAGETLVTITDSLGCSVSVPVIVTGPDPLQANAQVIGPGCPGECNGSIALEVSGGNGGNTFLWSPEVEGQGTGTATALCPGAYEVTITDTNGCTVAYTHVLDEPVEMSIALDLAHNTCFGDCQGAAQLTITGGLPDPTIIWSGPGGVIAQDVTGVNGLCAGTYAVAVTDANACTVEQTFTIGEGDAILPGLTFVGETCNGPCDGEAAVAPDGGAGSFTVLWQPGGETTLGVAGLCAGDHTVTITDAIGCDTTATFTIGPWTPITDNATVTDVACTGDCTGSIVLAPAGGIGTYAFTWLPGPGSSGPAIADLCAGAYQATITDAVGCNATFQYFIAEPDTPLTILLDDVTAATCTTSDDGSIAISLAGGTPPYTLAWGGPDGFTSDQEDISGLPPGSYTVTVSDTLGCTGTMDVEVPAEIGVTADAGTDQQHCAGTGIVLDGRGSTGATTYTWTDADGNELGSGPVVALDGPAPGTHTFILTASDGPCTDTDTVTVTVFDLAVADAGPDRTIFHDEQTELGGDPTGPPGSTFVWQPDSVLSSGSAADPTAFPTITTWFVVTVTTPDGCVAQDSVLVTVMPEVDIPSGFTPNGDGWNDTWTIGLIELFPQCEVEIYNRWGEMLFRSVGYRTPWDGRYDGAPVPVGTYYFVVQLNDERFPEPYTGPLTIIR
jgi:gliding motility-associated-like protein